MGELEFFFSDFDCTSADNIPNSYTLQTGFDLRDSSLKKIPVECSINNVDYEFSASWGDNPIGAMSSHENIQFCHNCDI